jgi:dimeric dUTPase (all-alpha-NTP-PPase superfamily)
MQELLELQKELDEEISKHFNDPSILQIATALSVEASELIDACGLKYWKKKPQKSREEIIEEGIDVLHFLLSFFNHLGLNEDEIKRAYKAKWGVNFKRLRIEDSQA